MQNEMIQQLEELEKTSIGERSELEAAIERDIIDVEVSEIVVDDEQSYQLVASLATRSKDYQKRVKEFFEPTRKLSKSLYDAILAQRKQLMEPAEKLEQDCKKLLSDYKTKQLREEQERQRKAEAERREREEAERKRIQAEAEAAAAAGAEEEAKKLRKEAESVIVIPETPAHVAPKTTNFAGGTATGRKDVEVTVVDMQALLSAIIRGEAPESIIEVRQSDLKRFVVSQGLKAFPGLAIEEKVSVALRSSRAS